jgi:hypothetical protein
MIVVGDVGSNLVHRKRLLPHGAGVRAERVDRESELVASTDIWFRPVQFANAPDGGLWIIDMQREVIEHPASLAPPITQHLDLTSGRDSGRLWRLAAAGTPRRATPRLSQAGIPVGVSLAPLIPFVNEPEIESILDAAHAAGARYANYVVLRLPWELVEVFHAWLDTHFPDRRSRVIARLRDMRGGKDNDPRFGWRMRGQGPWADMIRMRVDARLRRLDLGHTRPALRSDRFVPPRPSAAPVARPVQGSLF